MSDIKTVIELMAGRSQSEMARICAYLLAPGIVVGVTISSSFGGLQTLESSPPIAVSELKTKLSSSGELTPQSGFALVIEPVTSEHRIEFDTQVSEIWSSLDYRAAMSNIGRLTLDNVGLSARAPFLGVADPVTVVVQGRLPNLVQVPGGSVSVEELVAQPRRSTGIVTSVLLACIFAFGMAAASGLASIDPDEDAT